ncbi:MAG TPA: endo-1,4-beta-xylanase [Rhizomicrobium sp.]|nr:endo-1,4-beta-xylanase [Rhizomicrobium sp.]
MSGLSRRDWMAMAGTAAAAGMTASAADAAPAGSLHAIAAAKGLGFGSCIGNGAESASFKDEGVRGVHVKECGIVVPENELKWVQLRPNPKEFTFYPADQVIEWGEANGMKVRGHTLLWHKTEWMPDWLNKYDFGPRPAAEAERLLREHITTVCSRYGNRIFTYDVVNETIDPETGNIRDTVLSRHLGDAVVDICFDAARKAAPQARLVYNDYMSWSAASARHRDGVLKLLNRLKTASAPVQLLGIQSHIGPGLLGGVQGTRTFDAKMQADWKSFLDSVVGMGFDLAVTEFDVSEVGTPSDIAERDKVLADLTRLYFDFMLAYKQVNYVMAWGMVDHYSWLQTRNPRPDGMMKRGLLYDDNYQPKLMRQALADAFRAAPARESKL